METTRLSRRNFVENSALALGLLGSGSLATKSFGAETTAPSPAWGSGQVNAREHGAKGDGKTDDTKALQAALDLAKSKGPVCYVPAGLYRLDGSLRQGPISDRQTTIDRPIVCINGMSSVQQG